MKENPIDYDRLPMHSLWDGSLIRRTINCDGCRYLVHVIRDVENLEVCAWGVAWKVLREVNNPRKCFKIGKEPPKYSSLEEIRKIYESCN